MKVKFTDKISTREGDEAEVTPAAAKRLITKGYAEQVGAKAKAEAAPEPAKPAAKKTAAKKTATKKAATKKA